MVKRSLTKNLIWLLFVAGINTAIAARVLSKDEYQNLFMASFTYMATVKACEISSLYALSDDTVNRVIKYGYTHSLHDEQTQRISQNVSFYTSKSIEAYQRAPKISCADAASTMRTIAYSAQQFN
ncbi:hypothetical protein BCM14_2163 [Jezberella montanilacus]|uniref:Uncharacterized protein n=1 Tax=Jezberella montanilacus TaxID=323426 RepID=A0A2T0XFH5_9BURK|nr:hypothetical protein BCM14_2163 [Jezberella montanilacus]